MNHIVILSCMVTMDFPQPFLPLQGMIRNDFIKRRFNPNITLNTRDKVNKQKSINSKYHTYKLNNNKSDQK